MINLLRGIKSIMKDILSSCFTLLGRGMRLTFKIFIRDLYFEKKKSCYVHAKATLKFTRIDRLWTKSVTNKICYHFFYALEIRLSSFIQYSIEREGYFANKNSIITFQAMKLKPEQRL